MDSVLQFLTLHYLIALNIKHFAMLLVCFICPPAGPSVSIQTQIASHLIPVEQAAQIFFPGVLCIITHGSLGHMYGGHVSTSLSPKNLEMPRFKRMFININYCVTLGYGQQTFVE